MHVPHPVPVVGAVLQVLGDPLLQRAGQGVWHLGKLPLLGGARRRGRGRAGLEAGDLVGGRRVVGQPDVRGRQGAVVGGGAPRGLRPRPRHVDAGRLARGRRVGALVRHAALGRTIDETLKVKGKKKETTIVALLVTALRKRFSVGKFELYSFLKATI